MVSDHLLSLVRCPACGGTLDPGQCLHCHACGSSYARAADHLDLRPPDGFAEQTKYLDEALHADARHETVSPPLLSAAVRNDMLRRMLAPRPADRVVDLGCGSGRVLAWNRDLGAYQVGTDVSPFFAVEARRDIDLALADLRRLPFCDGAFTKAYALDVFEHLSPEALADVLREAARVLEGRGRMFVYSHVRRNSRLASGLRLINHVARHLERAGAIDLSQERLRKSDHLNPLADIPDLERTVAAAGFRIVRIRYYTPLIGGLVENILLRLAERWLARRPARRDAALDAPAGAGASSGAAGERDGGRSLRAARLAAKARIARRGPVYFALRAVTAVMKLDVLLFGRVRSGPFFALLEKREAGAVEA